MNIIDLIWTVVAFVLTLLVLSYAFAGDNPFFRAGTYIFIGMAAAYVVLVTFNQVIWAKLVLTLFRPDAPFTDKVLLIVPFALGLMLLIKAFPRHGRLATLPMAFLVGTGAGAMIAGVLLGTLFPQALAVVNAFDLHSGRAQTAGIPLVILEGIILLAGTAATLLYFQFSTFPRQGSLQQHSEVFDSVVNVGRVFIAITLGALFAGVYAAALTALIERLAFLWNSIF